MLYDPKWEKTETKVAVYSFANLIAWLERHPAETPYCFTFPQTCLVAQYLKAHGEPVYCLSAAELDRRLPGLTDVAQGDTTKRDVEIEWTYGAALERARAALTSSQRHGE